jgi:DNA polymerase III delta prime subunit
MPDGGSGQKLTYELAVRGKHAPLLMISGPSGVGKTYSALRLARGMAGPKGKICVADTDNSRARLYADEFQFHHLNLVEPFRPKLFEQAAEAAQQQKADVLVIDNFSHEWAGPGGVLEWHEEELTKLTKGDVTKRDALNMVGWGRVKPHHKHMLQRLYRLNMSIILCCAAERKIAMVEVIENNRKKIKPVDQGFQPIGDKDAAFAMTASLMLEDVKRPGVPRPIKALLPALQPIIALDKPLDEETGRRIAAWANGVKPAAAAPQGTPQPAAGHREETSETPPASHDPPADASPDPPPAEQPGGEPTGEQPGGDAPMSEEEKAERRLMAGAEALAHRFAETKTRKDHNAIVDDPQVQQDLTWLQKNRKDVYDTHVKPFITESWKRTDAKNKQGELGT